MSSNVWSPNFYSNWIIWIMEHNFYDQVHVLFFIIIMIKTEIFYNHEWSWVFILPISLPLNQFETCRTLFCFQKNLSSVEELLWCILFTHSKTYQCLSVRMGFLLWKLNTQCWSLHHFLLLSSLLPLPERRSRQHLNLDNVTWLQVHSPLPTPLQNDLKASIRDLWQFAKNKWHAGILNLCK